MGKGFKIIDEASFNSQTEQSNQGDTMKKQNTSPFDKADLCIIADALHVMCESVKVNMKLLSKKMGHFSIPLHPLHAAEFFLYIAEREWVKDACGSLSPRIVDEIIKEALARFGLKIASEGLMYVEDSFQDWSECLETYSDELSSINNRLLNFLDLCGERLHQYERIIDGEGESV